MTDLAAAIVDLGKSAQSRKSARRHLEEAAATVAAAIRKHLRRGDEVEVEYLALTWNGDHAAEPVWGPLPADNAEGAILVTYSVQRFRGADGTPQTALCREDTVLEHFTLRLREYESPDGTPDDLVTDREGVKEWHAADEDDLEHFAREAGSVAKAFEEKLADEARSWDESAQLITKLVVR